jgi:glucose-1-phosphate cytidylyltransferase
MMKVVLFCGGFGTRLRDVSPNVPKPLVPLGLRPIIWHVMKYYAHYGHNDFILCLGYKADAIKEYFLNYDECLSNDFVLSKGARKVDLLRKDIEDWRITFVDTGISSNIGERLKAVEPFLADEEMFLANYSDGLTDFPLPTLIDEAQRSGSIGTFLAVRPNYSFHFVSRSPDGTVLGVDDIISANAWINGGYFVFRREIFDYIRPGEELVEEPFRRLIAERKLRAHDYAGFWRCVDTFKDLQALEALLTQGDPPWEVWRKPEDGRALSSVAESLVLRPRRKRRREASLSAAAHS